ncbi:uncharacterized protein FIBRA_06149 [Fibroporia radiculosa]|uniref:Uncharacterized protein n=1 Tax=Fibroporia radiculosa TaxID=599839 RepID=J4GAQ9_9APHY|nr:uncharacterized protein FIBRA_06149 [Fibroporia radiculosa]CCM03993.1 predicted protein [Fibroporia radiculosa]
MHGNEDKSDFERSAVIRGSQAPTNEMRDPSAPLDPATVYLRTERQTLRRLPRSGGIIFTIRVYQTPVVELAEEPGVPGRLASGVRGWSDDVAEYKDLFAYKDILSYLDERHADQVEKGVVAADDRTAVYPL